MNSVAVWLSSFSHVEEFGSSAFTASTHSGSAPPKTLFQHEKAAIAAIFVSWCFILFSNVL